MVAFLRTRKKLAALVASLLTLGMIALVSTQFSDPVLAVSDGSPYVVDQVVDTNPDPTIVETTITAQAAAVDIASGVTASVLTFNGTVPGPEFRLHVGDTVIVHFKNDIAHATAIHWHGIELANASDGTPLTQNMVAPGDTFLYKFKVTRPGIFWYHPHHHSSTNQVFKGMYGSIIVTDPAQDGLQGNLLPSAADTMTMVLSDLTVCKAADSNDTATYDTSSQPHVSGGMLPAQGGPTPKALCEAAPDGEALDEDGAPRGDYSAGDVPNIQKPIPNMAPVNEGQTVLTNGMNVGARGGSPTAPGMLNALAFKHNVLAGQGLRLQLINAATTRFFRLILTTQGGVQVPLIRVGGQGGVLNNARLEGDDPLAPPGGFLFKYTQGEILLDPGDRADVVAIIPGGTPAGEVLTMWTQDFGRTGGGAFGFANIPTVPVAHFNVTGPAGTPYVLLPGDPLRATLPVPSQVETLGAATINLLDPATDFSPVKSGMAAQEIELTAAPGASLGINDKQGTHDFPGDYTAVPHELSARYAAAIGGTLELTVKNTTSAHHPFHLHGFSIQPLSLTKAGGPDYTFGYAEFRDNIDVPKGYTLHFRTRLDDRPLMDGVTPGGGLGRWVFHCHIFFHAVFGMISEFDVVAADGNERPHINVNDTLIEGNASDELTVSGTYMDPDGDTPITLTASAGTITDDGGGLWTWKQTGAVSGLVYVTATDPDGLKDQVAFELHVNQPPTLVLPAPQTGTYTDVLSFGISATDPDAGDTIVLGASGLPTLLAFTDNGDRTGSVTGTLTATPGPYIATFTANDGHNDEVSDTLSITVEKETTVLTYTGPTMILNGGLVTLTATLLEDDGPPVIGRTVSFTLGAQACNGLTNASGVASCGVVVAGALGPKTITADFAGDTFYKPSSDSDPAIVFAFPPHGVFVLGNNSATGSVTWWDAQWSTFNALSGGAAPAAFKGFAGTVTLPTTTPPASCAMPWNTSGGDSPKPADMVPGYMGVLVSSGITKSGNVISGNTTQIVVVKLGSGSTPTSPGKTGTGIVVGVFCQ